MLTSIHAYTCPFRTNPSLGIKCKLSNIMGVKLRLNFGAKFQCSFIISHVKLPNCYGNGSIAQRQDGLEVNDEDVLCRTKAILEIFVEDTIGNL